MSPATDTANRAESKIARIISNDVQENPEYRELVLEAPHVARHAVPGQFVHVKLPGSVQPFLRRPFSIAGLDGDRLAILYKSVGEQTGLMAGLVAGNALDVLGPLGTGYDLTPPPADKAFLIGGGYGVAPLFVLAKALKEMAKAKQITLLIGARSSNHLLWRQRLATEGPWLRTAYATDDGSAGKKGTVIDLLAELNPAAGDRLYACGPMPMLAALHAKWPDLPIQSAVENQMGCGIGVCLGCVLPMTGQEGVSRFSRICTDGPVYDGHAIDWAACPR